jgi:N-acetylneuraminate synthase/N,N'-diacetyllegionaminate synthase
MKLVPEYVEFAGRRVGPGYPALVIAEAGVNHNGDLELARQLIDTAVRAKADAVKFQTFITEESISPVAPQAAYQRENTGKTESMFDMVKRLELPLEAFAELSDYCKHQAIIFLSSPFDVQSVDVLEKLDVPLFKIASGEITNLPFLAYIAAKRRPIILSTGMSYLEEVETALRTIEQAGDPPVILLHCVSNYPAAASDVNLRAMAAMAQAFGLPIGYSDHTSGVEVALAAVALGACVIEKHFTLDQNLPGPDHKASLEPAELTRMVQGIRTVEASLGHGRKEPAASEMDTARVARKSIVAARDIRQGETLTLESIAIKRPGTGLPPAKRDELIGRKARTNIAGGTPITFEVLE